MARRPSYIQPTNCTDIIENIEVEEAEDTAAAAAAAAAAVSSRKSSLVLMSEGKKSSKTDELVQDLKSWSILDEREEEKEDGKEKVDGREEVEKRMDGGKIGKKGGKEGQERRDTVFDGPQAHLYSPGAGGETTRLLSA